MLAYINENENYEQYINGLTESQRNSEKFLDDEE